jgi:hypothetical protein
VELELKGCALHTAVDSTSKPPLDEEFLPDWEYNRGSRSSIHFISIEMVSINSTTHVVFGKIKDTAKSQSGSHSDPLTFTPTTNVAKRLISLSGPLAHFIVPIKFANAVVSDAAGAHLLGKLPMLTAYTLVSVSDVLSIASAISSTGNSFHFTWKAST